LSININQVETPTHSEQFLIWFLVLVRFLWGFTQWRRGCRGGTWILDGCGRTIWASGL